MPPIQGYEDNNLYQYNINGRKIANDDKEFVHNELGLEFLDKRRIKKLYLTYKRPDLLDLRNNVFIQRRSKIIQSLCNHYWK